MALLTLDEQQVLHQLFVVVAACGVGDEEPVEDGPDAKTACGEQLDGTKTYVADVEAVDAKIAEQNGENQCGCRAFVILCEHHLECGFVHLCQPIAQGSQLLVGEIFPIESDPLVDFGGVDGVAIENGNQIAPVGEKNMHISVG